MVQHLHLRPGASSVYDSYVEKVRNLDYLEYQLKEMSADEDAKPLVCSGCRDVPRCGKYTEYGISRGKPDALATNQAGVVLAVQEWLVEAHPNLQLHYTLEDFTPESLKEDGMDYDLVITNTRNPSWYVVKPF